MPTTEVVAIQMGAPKEVALLLEEGCIKNRIVFALEKSHLLGQLFVESQNFTKVVEDHRYSAENLLKTFRGRNGLNTIEQARRIIAGGRDAIFEAMYGLPWGGLPGKLGNTQKGDGARFPGRGYKQGTGRDNYTRYSMWKYGDLRVVNNPEMMAQLPDAVDFAFWYWCVDKKLGRYALADDVLAVSRGVNMGNPNAKGTPNGIAARERATNQAKSLFGLI